MPLSDVTAVAQRLCGRPGPLEPAAADLLACARRNRVHLLLAGRLDPDNAADVVLCAELRDEYREAAARDAIESAAVRELFMTAAAHGVRPLLFKGAALAHRVYERSWERPRGDIDIFVAEEAAPAMRRALEAAGYRRAAAVRGTLVTRQFQYSDPASVRPDVDVHTRLFNPAAFADVLDWSTAEADAVALLSLGPAVRTLSDADALLAACVHRVAHHREEADLMWICDIDRLARRLSEEHWSTFVSRAERGRVRAVCGSSLAAAARLLETPVPASVIAALAVEGDEPSASFLHRRSGELHVQWLNLRHLPGWRARALLLLQHLFPSRDYMQARYGSARPWRLPLCYVHRLWAGVPRWIRANERSL